MTIYVVSIAGEVQNVGFTSLKSACDHLGVSYDSAVRGKRVWEDKAICEVEVNKIKGRSRKW